MTTFARADCAARRGNWNRTANTAGSKQRLPVNINSLLRCAAKVFTRYRRQGRERAGPSVDKRLAIHTPEMAAENIVDGVAKGHARVVVGWEAKALDVLARIIGPRYQRITATLVSRFAPWAPHRRDTHHAA